MKAKDLRKQDRKPKDREPCFICGKHAGITEYHHVVPLKRCADIFNKKYAEALSVPTVWLCPNHHAYAHLIFDENASWRKFAESVERDDLSDEEFKKFEILKNMEEEFYFKLFRGDA